MTDNEKIVALQGQILQAINGAPLPLGVKALVLENTLLRVTAALQQAVPPAAEQEES